MSKEPFKLLAVVLVLLLFLPQTVSAGECEEVLKSDYIKEVIELIKEKYQGKFVEAELYRAALEKMTVLEKTGDKNQDRKMLLEAALKGVFNNLDPYTTYFSFEEGQEFIKHLEGEYGGVGVCLAKIGESILVTEVLSGTPAEQAELAPGDKIISIDGQKIDSFSLELVTSLIRGKIGTTVNLELERIGLQKTVLKQLIREKIKINPTSWKTKNDLGYLKIEFFNGYTQEFAAQALAEMDKKGINKIIVDLRDNPGGDVEQAAFLAKMFIPKGLITRLDFKAAETKDLEYYSQLSTLKYRIVVLVNSMSASAAEIFAGAVQDTNSGILVGTKTYGKSKVQNLIVLLTPQAFEKYKNRLGIKTVDAYELITKYEQEILTEEVLGLVKMTTGEYLTPKGRTIDQIGLTPDIVVDEQRFGMQLHKLNKLSKTEKPGLGSQSIEVYRAETILKIAGYEVDEPDLILDQKTFTAVSLFQQDTGLFPYGVLDFSTQQSLNERLEQLLLANDLQYAKCVELLES